MNNRATLGNRGVVLNKVLFKVPHKLLPALYRHHPSASCQHIHKNITSECGGPRRSDVTTCGMRALTVSVATVGVLWGDLSFQHPDVSREVRESLEGCAGVCEIKQKW